MNQLYKQLLQRKKTPKAMFLLARLFGKKAQFTDSGYQLTVYYFREQIFVAKFEKRFDK